MSSSGMSPASGTARRAHHLDAPHLDATMCGPPLNTHYTALEGTAALRISTSRDSR